jgi:serine/threonine-protein kinase
MSAADSRNDGSLPLPQAQRINAICDRFERAWQAGPRPRLEDYLDEVPEPERSALLRELIALDMAYRQQAGEQPQPDDYRARFSFVSLPSPVTSADPLATSPEVHGAAATSLPQVPGYELLRELGRGGMGVVYLARQVALKRVVALKMILVGAHAGPAEVARFRREAEAAARLQHPHIVQVHEIGVHEGLPYLSLEYVEGGSLAQKLAGTSLRPRESAWLVETLARAVQGAHQRGIVHRDLKPANVLLTGVGDPKITDFGLAKCLDDASGPTATKAILGTPSYMAPEQAGGQSRQVGPAADVYALGAILYELLTGRPPFKADTPLETLQQVQFREPVLPSRLKPKLPRDLVTICLKCLQKEPARRYGSAEELAEDLRRFRAGESIRGRSVSRTEKLWRWCRRNPTVAALTTVIALLVVALILGKNGQPSKPTESKAGQTPSNPGPTDWSGWGPRPIRLIRPSWPPSRIGIRGSA